ncbi:MAG TPA: bifunctional glutamate N-acetyltransferase/amino-acid acetyltransferase ArgJ [Terriglobales bacterium]|nr:bifunctional glutamate N-acetyltransferase/amino-acid acetyltransferase ArgJ [Terriglobales bacterium]
MSAATAPGQKIEVPSGFLFSAVAAGIKASGRPDLASVGIPATASAAAVFTTNRVVAAPLEVDREHLERSRGRVSFLIVNAGNANCATGAAGRRDCERVCREAARLLKVRPESVFPSSTGVIGVPLPAEKIVRALPELIAASAEGEQAAESFARAIMTTDTRPKIVARRIRAGSRSFALLGIAKGAGMIHPNVATMLVYLFTDVEASPRELQPLLRSACDDSVNCISVDGDTSTNDTVLLLASGASGLSLRSPGVRGKFVQALNEVCKEIALHIISDGEGVKHVIRLRIEQARNRNEAMQVARTIAHSPLVKTAWAGADPNWGRILAAAGRSGVALDPRRINIFFGDLQICRRGGAAPFEEREAHAYLTQPQYDVRVQLGRGRVSLDFLTCDLTTDYVHINADYTT